MRNDARPRLRQILMEAVFRRQRFWWTVFLTVVGLTLLLILFLPRRYESTAKLAVANLRPRSTLSAGIISRVVTTDDVSQTQINSEVDLLKSQGVMRAALGLPNAPATDDKVNEADQKTVKALQDHLSIDPVRDSSIIDVKLVDKTPGLANQHLNGILDAYLEQRRNLTQSANAVDFFDRQVEAATSALDTARAQLTDFDQTHNLVDMEEQKKLQIERIAAIEDRIANARATLANQGSRTQTFIKRLAVTPERTETLRRSLTNQYSQERLSTTVVELKNRRDELLKRYPPTDRQVLALNQNIITAQASLDDAAKHPAVESATDVNPIWQNVTTSLVASSADVSGASAERAELERQRASAETRLKDLLQSTEGYDVLKRRFDEAQADYKVYVQKRDEARVGAALDRNQLFDVSLVQRPVVSTIPVRPKPLQYGVAGLVLAALLASALSLYADSSNPLVYTPNQLDAVTGVRTSGTLAENNEEENRLEIRRLLSAMRASLDKTLGPEDVGVRRIAITSTQQGEGVTWVARHLAYEAARQVKQRVALLDMTRLLQKLTAGRPIFTALQRDPASMCWEFIFPDALTQEQSVVALGEISQQTFWADLEPALARISRQFDLMFFDCPSLKDSTLVPDLDGLVDGYLAVVSADAAPKRSIRQMAAFLQQTHTPVLGYLLNRRRYPIPPWLYRIL